MDFVAYHIWIQNGVKGLTSVGNKKYTTPPFSCPEDPEIKFHVCIDFQSNSVHLQFANGCAPSEDIKINFSMKVADDYYRPCDKSIDCKLERNFLL